MSSIALYYEDYFTKQYEVTCIVEEFSLTITYYTSEMGIWKGL